MTVIPLTDATVHATNGSVLTMPNPYTPSVWIDPGTATQWEIFRFMIVAIFAIHIYDVSQSLLEDYHLISKNPFCFPTFVFLFSRLSTFACMAVVVVAHTAGIRNCENMKYAGCILYAVAHGTTGYLFCFRVHASDITQTHKTTRLVVLVALLFVVGGSISSMFAIETTRIVPTQHCITRVEERGFYMILAYVAQTIYDLLVLLTISYNLAPEAFEPHLPLSRMSRWRHFRGHVKRSIFKIGKRLIQESQVYFSLALLLKLLATAWFYIFGGFKGGASGGLNLGFVFFDMVVVNILATSIFRRLKLRQRGLNEPIQPEPTQSEPNNSDVVQVNISIVSIQTHPPSHIPLEDMAEPALAGVEFRPCQRRLTL